MCGKRGWYYPSSFNQTGQLRTFFFFSLSAITMLFSVKLPVWFWPWHTLQWMGGNKGWEDSVSITLGWQIEQNLSGA